MIAVLGGLGAALSWAIGTLCSSRSARMLGPFSVVAWVMLVGLVLNLGLLAVVRPAWPTGGATWGWMAVGGVGNVVGLLLAYAALRVGKVGLVTPITSTEGAIAAVVAVIAGEPLGVATAVVLLVITAGVALAAALPRTPPSPASARTPLSPSPSSPRSPSGSACTPPGTSPAPSRCPGSCCHLGWSASSPSPCRWSSRAGWRSTRPALPLVVVAGVAEVVGFASYALGARHGIAVAAVLASQFAVFAGIGAYLLFRERLTRLQLAGASIVIVGVAVLSFLRA